MEVSGKGKKSGYCAIVGRPNVGKSTLMNHLIGQKIAITSGKPQTTRTKIRTVYTDERGQIVFLDTPGIHKAKNRLGEYMDELALETLPDSDVILWILDAGQLSREEDGSIRRQLKLVKKPVILVLNKVDQLKKEDLPEILKKAESLFPAVDIIPVSALRSVNMDSVLEAVYSCLPEGPYFYDEEEVTDATMREIAGEIIREKALRSLQDEVPHGIAVQIQSMKERQRKKKRGNKAEDGPVLVLDPDFDSEQNGMIWDIEADLITEKESHKGIIIGKGGSMLKKIGMEARAGIEEMTGSQVNLKLYVKVRKDWRDNPAYLRSLGYSRKKI